MKLKLVEAVGRETMPPRHSLIIQMERDKQNLERTYFYLQLCVFQFVSSSFKINGMAFYCSFFIFLEG